MGRLPCQCQHRRHPCLGQQAPLGRDPGHLGHTAVARRADNTNGDVEDVADLGTDLDEHWNNDSVYQETCSRRKAKGYHSTKSMSNWIWEQTSWKNWQCYGGIRSKIRCEEWFLETRGLERILASRSKATFVDDVSRQESG